MSKAKRNYWRTEPSAMSVRGLLGAIGYKSRKCRNAQELILLASKVFGLEIGLTSLAETSAAIKALSLEQRRIVAYERGPPKSKKEWAPSQREIDAFYDSWDWKRVRYDYLKGQDRICMCCGSTKEIRVDHIKPIRRYWGMRFDPTNLQVLCEDCNMGKGSRDETDWRRVS